MNNRTKILLGVVVLIGAVAAAWFLYLEEWLNPPPRPVAAAKPAAAPAKPGAEPAKPGAEPASPARRQRSPLRRQRRRHGRDSGPLPAKVALAPPPVAGAAQ
jgi:hypothetical protein